MREQPKILLTGMSGQVGFELARSLQGLGHVFAPNRECLNLNDLGQIKRVIRDLRPGLIINPAAYTAVDKAEDDPNAAMRSNAEAPGVIAEEARRLGAALVHYSTDYVFDGKKSGAYIETDPANPQNLYGKSKLAGEQAIASSGCMHLILRTSWVYSRRGSNFLLSMLRLGAVKDELGVVADQTGAPTWANTIATLTSNVLSQAVSSSADWWSENSGIYHLTASGSTSWHGFAQAIFDNSELTRIPKVNPILAVDYPTRAVRPTNSLMSNEKFFANFGLKAPSWDAALRLCMAERS